VRELRNVLERAVIVAAEGTIDTTHLPPKFAGAPATAGKAQRPGELRLPVGYTMDQAERALIEMTLDYTRNSKVRTAEILGFSQKTLFNKLREHGLTLEAGPAKFPRMFVLMPFEEVLRPVFEGHIKPTAAALGLSCGRADDLFTAGPIIQDTREAINEADIIVADCTGRNANVFYEIGIAHTLCKDTILIAQTLDDVPFDLRHLRVIHYRYTPHGMSEFEDQLKKTVLALLPVRRPSGAAS
jgi:Bacterial regulatory protein, Fis family